MNVDGDYEGEIGTLFQRGTVRVRLANGEISGVTQRGTTIVGRYWFDPLRKTHQYEATAHMPAFFEAITGIVTGANGRAVSYRGEVTPMHGQARFSVDFAGRAIDVLMRRV
jgi:hypothetical protein